MEWVPALRDWVASLGALGTVAFGAVYVLCALLFVPGAVLTLVAGGLFGPWYGLLIVGVSTSVADAAAFLVGRYLARDMIAGLAARYRRFGAIDVAVTDGGWRVVALLRLSPTVPYSASNYLYGLTGIGFWPYWITSGVFTLPGIFAYIYLGHVGAETVRGDPRSTFDWVMMVFGLTTVLVAMAYIAILARRRLALQTPSRTPSTR